MSRVEMHPVSQEGLTHIVRNLRERDRREIFAMRWNDDEGELVAAVYQVAGDLWRMWTLDGEPVAVNGVVPVRPGVVIAGAFGTRKWRAVVRPMTRWSLDYVLPVLRMSGHHRGEAYVLATNTDSRRWIELLGGEVECLLKGYGRGREDFLLYAWDLTQERSEHVLQRRRRQQRSTHGAGAQRQRWVGLC
jgi:hypothetical protein